MADFVEVIRQRDRMCEASFCESCSANVYNATTSYACGVYLSEHPEEYEAIVMKWAEEHPIKTKWDKLVEIFGAEMAETLKITPDDWLKWFDEYKEPEVKPWG